MGRALILINGHLTESCAEWCLFVIESFPFTRWYLWNCFDTSLLLWLMTHCRKIPVYSMRGKKDCLVFFAVANFHTKNSTDVTISARCCQNKSNPPTNQIRLLFSCGSVSGIRRLGSNVSPAGWIIADGTKSIFLILPNGSLCSHSAALLEFSHPLPPPHPTAKKTVFGTNRWLFGNKMRSSTREKF